MIIASGGECQGPSVMPKKRDNTQTGSDLQLLRRELDVDAGEDETRHQCTVILTTCVQTRHWCCDVAGTNTWIIINN